jgi:hypothetical protein
MYHVTHMYNFITTDTLVVMEAYDERTSVDYTLYLIIYYDALCHTYLQRYNYR